MKNPLRFLSTRPANWSILGFRFVPLLLFAVGTCAILYGGFFHRRPVTETREEEYTEVEPTEPSMPMGMMPDMGQDDPFNPPVKFVTKIKTVETTAFELEWDLNVLMTFGGIARNEKGELVRLAVGKDGPAFCPT